MQHQKERIMVNKKKAAPAAKNPAPAAGPAAMAKQGLESFIATQKILLDLVAQQNSLAIGFVRERVNFSPLRPLTGMVELAGYGLVNFVAAQKILLDLAADENALVLTGVKDGLGLSGTAAAVTDAVRDGVNAFVAMQKKFLSLVEEQGAAAFEAIKEGKPYEGKNLSEVTREGIENFVHTQKKMLDLVVEVAAPHSNGKAAKKGAKPATERREMMDLAKEGLGTFVVSQKKLMDVAQRQVGAVVKTAKEMVQPSPEPSTSLGEFARRGVENFITAQKSLLDVVMKPFTPAPHVTAQAHPAARRTRHA
jgi:hypothetical protein